MAGLPHAPPDRDPAPPVDLRRLAACADRAGGPIGNG